MDCQRLVFTITDLANFHDTGGSGESERGKEARREGGKMNMRIFSVYS